MRKYSGIKTKKIVALLILMLFMMAFDEAMAANDYNYTLDPNSGRRVYTPLAYEVSNFLVFEVEGKPLKDANKIFIDKKGLLYIVDTGNNRIIKSYKNGNVIGVYTEAGGKPFNQPRGIFVDEDGDMYIADTKNQRIVHLLSNGEYIEEFGNLDSPLLGKDFIFEPTNVCISPIGYIYTTKGHSILTIDANNEFRGYVGSIEIGFDLRRALIRMFATEEQKGRIARSLPPSYSNITITDDGIIYATSINTGSDQIIALNSVGKNIFPGGSFGETIDDEGNQIVPHFVDVAVDKNGIIYALEQKSGKVYQYTREGNLLVVFGGIGNKKGQFMMPSSLAVDENGDVYVLDSLRNNIQVFSPTKFIQTVHEAVIAHENGEYAKAKALWEEVLKIDASYSLAHRGIAKALMKEKKWREAMNEYKEAGDMAGYSEAFTRYRLEFVRNNFAVVFFAVVIGVIIGYFLFINLKRRAKALVDKYTKWQGGFEV